MILFHLKKSSKFPYLHEIVFSHSSPIYSQELVPIYKDLGIKVPYECPFFKERDRYLDNEDHKERESLNRWSCDYCGKAFIGEIYLDAHFDNRHADTIYKVK